MDKPVVLYGYRCSYYTRKVFCYLKHKNINFIEKRPNAFDMYNFQKKVGAAVMPVLQTPDGKYIQDSREIIDTLEAKHPNNPIIPSKDQAKKRFIANLIEAWTDDMWLGPAMHYRWNFSENYPVFRDEVGESLFPSVLVPKFVKNKAAESVATTLRKFVRFAGVTDEQKPAIEAWVSSMCDLLDAHFERSPYLLGSSASLADFGLAGPLVAHLAHDPYPLNKVMRPRTHLMRWVDRIQSPAAPQSSSCGDDVIPSTLEPILKLLLEEYIPLVRGTVDRVNELDREKFGQGRKSLPRILGPISFPLVVSSGTFTKAAMPFTLWRVQGLLGELPSLGEEQREQLRGYLTSVHPLQGPALLGLAVPRLTRHALRVKFSKEEKGK